MQEPVYFFVGNCQTQFLASIVGAVTQAPRYFLGRKLAINVSLEAPQATYLNQHDFLARADEIRASGRQAVLIGQETARGEFSALLRTEQARFSHQALLPYIHCKAAWPERFLRNEVSALSDNAIRRNRDLERIDLGRKFERCGIDASAFGPRYWSLVERDLSFYSPAHFIGPLFAEVLEAMGPGLTERLPKSREIIAGLRRSPGIFQNSFHPIHPRTADLLDLAWARPEFYQAWMGLRMAGDDLERLRAAARRAKAALNSAELQTVASSPVRAHFATSLGIAWIRLGRRRAGLALLSGAVVELKGFAPLLQKALRIAVRTNQPDVLEDMLVGVAPFVDLTRNLHIQTYDRTFRNAAGTATGRQAMSRAVERIASGFWLNGYLQSALASAT